MPLTNFLGWMFSGWVFFQLFELVESRFPPNRAAVTRASYWLSCRAKSRQFLICRRVLTGGGNPTYNRVGLR